jgi:hypothetical protein
MKMGKNVSRRSNNTAKRLPEKGQRIVAWGTRGRSIPERAAYIIIPLLIIIIAIILL